MSINWDDPAFQVTESAFANWDEIGPGGSIVGNITAVVTGSDFNGAPCPQLEIETESGPRTVTCGQADLKKKVTDLRPNVGDRIGITFTHIQPTASGFKKKFFALQHSPKAGTTPAPAPAPVAPAAGGFSDEPPF